MRWHLLSFDRAGHRYFRAIFGEAPPGEDRNHTTHNLNLNNFPYEPAYIHKKIIALFETQ